MFSFANPMYNFAGIAVIAYLVCLAVGPVLIPFLHKLKFGQEIRDCGPESHKKKSGTPTMGGMMIILAIVLGLLICGDITSHLVLMALLLMLGYGLIGFLDDYIKVVKKRNLGLTAKQKLVLQAIVAAAFIAYYEMQGLPTTIWLPAIDVTFDLGKAYYVLLLLVLVGTTNAVNLTDGLDGLVSRVTLPVAFTYAYICYLASMYDLAGFAIAVLAACAGFLVFNHYPAKVFMGDTGSLALGGAIAALALLTKTEFLLVIIGGVYVMEALSVMLQVTYFKLTHGKRIFRMSPMHHHFELGGWKETKVVAVFSMISCGLCLLGLALWSKNFL